MSNTECELKTNEVVGFENTGSTDVLDTSIELVSGSAIIGGAGLIGAAVGVSVDVILTVGSGEGLWSDTGQMVVETAVSDVTTSVVPLSVMV